MSHAQGLLSNLRLPISVNKTSKTCQKNLVRKKVPMNMGSIATFIVFPYFSHLLYSDIK